VYILLPTFLVEVCNLIDLKREESSKAFNPSRFQRNSPPLLCETYDPQALKECFPKQSN
jgi:hypothetical protein